MPTDSPLAAAALAYTTETAPVLALTLDAQQRVLSANGYARQVLGEEAVGSTLTELVVGFTPRPDLGAAGAPNDAGQMLSLNTAAGSPESFRFRFFVLPDGWLALGSLDFLQQARLQAEVLAMNRELNDLTRQLHQANAELLELNQLKNQFLGMAAHDLRKPVGVIMTYAEFVLDGAGTALSPDHRKFLQTCLAAATGMKRLIDSFLDLSVIESGHLRLELAPASAADILGGATEIARLIAAKKKVTLIEAPENDSRRLRVDVAKLQQVLLNLVGNAVEHSVAGQRVWLSSRWDEQSLVLVVRDEGPGLTPEAQARLFQPFAQAGTRKTAGERSVGLGLLITRKIVEAHGGRIWVESIPGQGAAFLFALPVELRPTKRTADSHQRTVGSDK